MQLTIPLVLTIIVLVPTILVVLHLQRNAVESLSDRLFFWLISFAVLPTVAMAASGVAYVFGIRPLPATFETQLLGVLLVAPFGAALCDLLRRGIAAIWQPNMQACPPGPVHGEVRRLATLIGSPVPTLHCSPRLSAPRVFGISSRRAHLALPADWQQVDAPTQQAALIHELAHLRNRDLNFQFWVSVLPIHRLSVLSSLGVAAIVLAFMNRLIFVQYLLLYVTMLLLLRIIASVVWRRREYLADKAAAQLVDRMELETSFAQASVYHEEVGRSNAETNNQVASMTVATEGLSEVPGCDTRSLQRRPSGARSLLDRILAWCEDRDSPLFTQLHKVLSLYTDTHPTSGARRKQLNSPDPTTSLGVSWKLPLVLGLLLPLLARIVMLSLEISPLADGYGPRRDGLVGFVFSAIAASAAAMVASMTAIDALMNIIPGSRNGFVWSRTLFTLASSFVISTAVTIPVTWCFAPWTLEELRLGYLPPLSSIRWLFEVYLISTVVACESVLFSIVVATVQRIRKGHWTLSATIILPGFIMFFLGPICVVIREYCVHGVGDAAWLLWTAVMLCGIFIWSGTGIVLEEEDGYALYHIGHWHRCCFVFETPWFCRCLSCLTYL